MLVGILFLFLERFLTGFLCSFNFVLITPVQFYSVTTLIIVLINYPQTNNRRQKMVGL